MYTVPRNSSADVGSMVKVNGNKTARAKVELKPGNAPNTIPSSMPSIAIMTL